MQVTRTFDILDAFKEKWPDKQDALASKTSGEWRRYSIAEYAELARNVSYGLLSLGFKKGDKIATISNNRPEWNFADMGMSAVGAVHVPIYPTISDEEFKYILTHSDARMLIVSDKSLYTRLKPIADSIPEIEKFYTFNEVEGAPNFLELIELGKQNADKYRDELVKVKESIDPGELVSIIYTSGTTGVSKGVMLSHNNIVSNVKTVDPRFNITSDFRVLSFLPLCHIYERMVNYIYQYKGVSIYYAESMATIADNLRELKVNLFVTVPRLLERVYDKIIGKGKDLKGIKKSLFFWAVSLGLKYQDTGNSWWYNFRLKIARKLIFSKWQQALGGKIEFIMTGGAAIQVRLARIFWAAGIPVLEGYGLTETSPVLAVNYFEEPGNVRFGTVGPPVDNTEIRIAEDGEILAKGPGIMLGYYKDPDQTAQAIDKDGWFHTGDIGVMEENKFLKITDRKKEIFKTSSGKYIAPQVIENKIKESLFIDQAMVVGENEKFVSAIIVPNFEFLHNWCSIHKVNYRDNEELIRVPDVMARFQREITEINAKLGVTEQIKRFRLVHEEWTPISGELSPTLKLRRNVVYEKYDHLMQEIYGHSSTKDEAELLERMKKKAGTNSVNKKQ
ncbi:MAG: long-chain fatty acid--CoA ligase [Marinilabiliales bacterium]|nr:MAG: long-chain fatty acid--CoA ligase [Marinilabiliales bacterium]